MHGDIRTYISDSMYIHYMWYTCTLIYCDSTYYLENMSMAHVDCPNINYCIPHTV